LLVVLQAQLVLLLLETAQKLSLMGVMTVLWLLWHCWQALHTT
jgi:hypothetical protein